MFIWVPLLHLEHTDFLVLPYVPGLFLYKLAPEELAILVFDNLPGFIPFLGPIRYVT